MVKWIKAKLNCWLGHLAKVDDRVYSFMGHQIKYWHCENCKADNYRDR